MSDLPSANDSAASATAPSLLRKYWYLVIPGLLLVAGLIYLGKLNDISPVTLLRDYGYYVVLIWTFLEGETIVIVAGMFSRRLGLNPWMIALAAFTGSFLSDQIMFSLGKYKGESVLKRFPRLGTNIDKAAALFKKYDIALILGFRFVYGVRNVTPILLGISGVSHKKFFFLNIIGAGVWAVAFTFGGLYSGKTFMHIMETIGHGLFFAILGGLVLLVGWIYYRKWKARKAIAALLLQEELAREDKETPPDIT